MTEQTEGLGGQLDPVAPFYRVAARIFGIMFLVAGLVWLGRELRFGWIAQSASGMIVEVRARESAEGPEFYPVVEFAANGGRIIRFDRVSTSPPPVAGTPVKVLYDPARPSNARIDSFVQRWLFGVMFASMGIVFLAAVSVKRSQRTGSATTGPWLASPGEDPGSGDRSPDLGRRGPQLPVHSSAVDH
jgi:hypothetical protein